MAFHGALSRTPYFAEVRIRAKDNTTWTKRQHATMPVDARWDKRYILPLLGIQLAIGLVQVALNACLTVTLHDPFLSDPVMYVPIGDC
jgi:hypothetical protein